MAVAVKEVKGKELEEAFQIRKEVFIEEQGVPFEDEFDIYDEPEAATRHILVYYGEQPAATGRLKKLEHTAKLERICVRAAMRKYGLGSEVVKSLERMAIEEDLTKAKVHAQTQARNFYEKLGYIQASEEFMEDGIPHIVMTKILAD